MKVLRDPDLIGSKRDGTTLTLALVMLSRNVAAELDEGASASVRARARLLARGREVGRSELVDDGSVAGLTRGGDRDSFDEASHCHLDVELDEVGEGMELDVAVWMSEKKAPSIIGRLAYTKEFGIDMAAMIMTSMSREIAMMRWLKRKSLLYFCRPLLMRFALTVFRKYQFNNASMTRYTTFSMRSHISLTRMYLRTISAPIACKDKDRDRLTVC
jgi:hypothetical protein